MQFGKALRCVGVAAAVGVSLLAVGCGGDNDDSSSEPTGPGATVESTTTTAGKQTDLATATTWISDIGTPLHLKSVAAAKTYTDPADKNIGGGGESIGTLSFRGVATIIYGRNGPPEPGLIDPSLAVAN